LDILDTAGEEFTTLQDLYMKNSDAFVLVYSIIDQNSLEHLSKILSAIPEGKQNAPIIFVGNKIDLHESRTIQFEEAHAMAVNYGTTLVECSAKANINIEPIFDELVKLLIAQKPQNTQNIDEKKKCTTM